MLLRMWIGCCVLPPGRPAQLFGEMILFWEKVDASRLFKIFMKSFRVVSRRVIGLVIFMSPIQSLDFGIEYIVPFFQSEEISPVSRILLKICVRTCTLF